MALVAPARKLRAVKPLLGTHPVLRVLVSLVVPVAMVVIWWQASANSTSLYFPPLSKIMSSFSDVWLSSMFMSEAVPSLQRFALGLLIAAVAGIGGGVLLGLWRGLGDAATPVLEFARATPGVALAPLAIVLFGIDSKTQVAIIAFAAVWPILLNTIDGVRSVDPVLIDVGRAYQISRRDRLLRVTLPSTGPQIMAGLNTAVAIGLIMIVVSELQGATNGIGYTLLQQQRSYNTPAMWASIVLLGLLGCVLNVGFRAAERVILRWHRLMRETSSK
ncbi:ABC transporter permease subunit [Streptomyces sp. NPDC093544]|jgi:sulfonate transport system permease protein|uniref:ABC transporter permease n=1 Tax=Streptomyces sp. NPDC093544 TaxID=3155200 RepID=UPI003431B7AF